MAKLLIPLETFVAGVVAKITGLQSALDAANASNTAKDATIAQLNQQIADNADPNLTDAGITAVNAQAVALGLATAAA